jgi:hypothetical protein
VQLSPLIEAQAAQVVDMRAECSLCAFPPSYSLGLWVVGGVPGASE